MDRSAARHSCYNIVAMDDAGQPVWDAGQYARFRSERARPFYDLLGRVAHQRVRTIADIGCGDGGLTRSLLDRWPDARIWGIDTSKEMLARTPSAPGLSFEQVDLRSWRPPVPLELVVSNAVLHWVADHDAVLRSFAGWLAPHGVLAIQMPNNRSETAYVLAGALAAEPPWRERLRGVAWDVVVEPARFYVERLAALGFETDLWETIYYHRLARASEIVEWIKGTALRPILTALDEDEGARFLAALSARVAPAYPEGPQGVLFPFRRLFFVAVRL
jgi:trans-aconitate 2-methyltransferase